MSVRRGKQCGYIAIVGRPNVGKSTLLNQLLGHKLSITSRKRQTTRHRILGIKTHGTTQAIYVDTPGLHRAGGQAMNRYMNKTAVDAIREVDVGILVVEGLKWGAEDNYVLERLRSAGIPLILAVNKIDRIHDKETLLPYLERVAAMAEFSAVIPVSAKTGENLGILEREVMSHLPRGEFFFPKDYITDRSERFLVSEIIREKLTRNLGQELPYALTVDIEEFRECDQVIRIGAVILVERKGQKAIIIGKGGSMLKVVGSQARRDIEKMLHRKVFLRLWVKIREGWADDVRALQSLGYHE